MDPFNQLAHLALAEAYLIRKDLDQFYIEADRAIAFNPNNAHVLAWLGLWMAYTGRWEQGLGAIDKAMALNPKHPGYYHYPYFFYHYQRREYALALAAAQKIDVLGYAWPHALRAAALAQLGRLGEARDAAAEIIEIDPDFSADARQTRLRLGLPEDLVEHLMNGLQKAGLDIPDEKDEPE